jgi:hypothetical protein
MKATIYVVKSGIQGFDGVNWLNLKAFTDYNAAKAFAKQVEKQIRPEDLDESEFVYIDELTIGQ